MPWRGWRENPLLHQLKQSWHQLVRTSKVCGDLLHWAVRWLCNSLVSVWLMKMSWGHNNVANLISFSSMREASRWTRQSSLAGDALPLKTGFSLRSLKYSVRQQFSTMVGITWKASRSAHPIPWEHQWLWFTYSRSQPGWRTTAWDLFLAPQVPLVLNISTPGSFTDHQAETQEARLGFQPPFWLAVDPGWALGSSPVQ